MKRLIGRKTVLVVLGLLSLPPYAYAFHLQDLRQHTVEFEYAFFAAFALYSVAVMLVLHEPGQDPGIEPDGGRSPKPGVAGEAGIDSTLAFVFVLAILFRTILIFTPPTLSDDMYRYVWDGRVQARGYSPYAYPPNADQLRPLRDTVIWPHINRPDAVTVYPAGAELAYAVIWRVWPDNARWFQIVMAAGDLVAGVLLVGLLRAMRRPPALVLIYLWSPLVIFESAHSAHVDGLVLPVLVAAWLARSRGRDAWTGILLGIATGLKLYPIILFPILWRPSPRAEDRYWRSVWVMPLALAAVIVIAYAPYVAQGAGVLGYLPHYFDETFNIGLAGLIIRAVVASGGSAADASRAVTGVLLAVLAIVSLVTLVRSASAEQAIRRCIWPMGVFTLLTQNLFPWYVVWILPLLALFLRPGRYAMVWDAWAGWFVLSGSVALAYTFFIHWTPADWLPWIEFGPLYALLVVPYVYPMLRNRLIQAGALVSHRAGDAAG